MSSTDVESLQPTTRTRSGCMDRFLLASVITLFVMVVGTAGAALVLLRNLREDLSNARSAQPMEKDGTHAGFITGDSSYKMQNFAYLRATQSELRNGTVTWEGVQYGTGVTVGASYTFNDNQHALKTDKEGTYFLYVNLDLSCTFQCTAGDLHIRFYSYLKDQEVEQLSCLIKLPGGPVSTHHTKKCWGVLPHLEKDSRLLAKMEIPKTGLENWKLEMNTSGYGIFLVDGAGLSEK